MRHGERGQIEGVPKGEDLASLTTGGAIPKTEERGQIQDWDFRGAAKSMKTG